MDVARVHAVQEDAETFVGGNEVGDAEPPEKRGEDAEPS